MFRVLHHPMDAETHNILPGRSFPVGGRWLGGRNRGQAISHLICMVLVTDLIACRLNFFMSAVACRPVRTLRLWSGFLVWLL